MKRVAFASCLLSSLLPAAAYSATAVYPGCAVPALKAGHHTFYVDPVKGSPKGDGSAAKPWRTLSEVLAGNSTLLSTMGHAKSGGTDPLASRNPNGPIKAGDVIMLMSGQHGAVFISNAFNSDFITVMAAPGQSPVLQGLAIQSSQKWLFQGLKIISDLGAIKGIGIVSLAYGDWLGQTNNIVLDNSSVATVEGTSGWTDSDWLSKPKNVGVYMPANTSCMTVTNSHVYNVVNGIGIDSTKSLVQGNTIEFMMNDGIDVTGSDVIIKGNIIKNGQNNALSTLHADGIQGWSPTVNGIVQVVSNVTIDSNTVTKTGDGSKSYMQGISIFDGKWNNLKVINNSVAVNAWNGIALSGLANSQIVNNTVYGTYAPHPARLSIDIAKDKTQSHDTTVRNNISQNIVITGNNMQVDHNIAQNSITIAGKIATSGAIGVSNSVVPNLTSGFTTINASDNVFDLRLRTSSAAVASGNSDQAPAVDILGKARSKPTDVGAYTH